MRRNLFYILFFILFLRLLADDAILGGDGHNVYPIRTEDIVMDSEKVEVTFLPNNEAYVECSFYFRNITDKKQSVLMGFPQELDEGVSAFEYDKMMLKNFAAYENGKLILYEVKTEKDSLYRKKLWYTFKVTFAPNETKLIKNTYYSNLVLYSTMGTSFNYILKSGSSWAGKIGKADIIFKITSPQQIYEVRYIRPKDKEFKVENNQISWHFEDFEPDFDISISFDLIDKDLGVTKVQEKIVNSIGNYPICLSDNDTLKTEGDFYPTWPYWIANHTLGRINFYSNNEKSIRNIVVPYRKIIGFYETRDIHYPIFSGKRKKGDNYNLYTFYPEHSGETKQLTFSEFDALGPRINGSKITYYVDKKTSSEIWIMDSVDFKPELLIVNVGDAKHPSIGGDYVVFESTQQGNTDIWKINLKTKEKQRLTDWKGFDGRPSVTKDGKKIAFVSDRSGNQDIYIMNIEGDSLTQITFDKATDFAPFFDIEGKKLAFTSFRSENKSKVFILPLAKPETH